VAKKVRDISVYLYVAAASTLIAVGGDAYLARKGRQGKQAVHQHWPSVRVGRWWTTAHHFVGRHRLAFGATAVSVTVITALLFMALSLGFQSNRNQQTIVQQSRLAQSRERQLAQSQNQYPAGQSPASQSRAGEMPISQPISASSSGSVWPWWVWVSLLVAAMALAAASLLAPRPRWASRVAQRAFWRRKSVRERVRGRRGLIYLYAGLLAAVLVVWSLPSLLTRHPRVVDAAARHTAITNTRTGLVATLAVLGASVGLAYTARTYRLSREGHLTDRYTKTVEQLGSDKIEVRLGGIYALERLMRDSSTDQPTIVEVLAAYIRQHAPPASLDEAKTAYPTSPDADVQAALTVLGRRTAVAAENPIDLTGVWLIEANLTGVDLHGANLTGAMLWGANLTDARLTRANLTGAYVTRGALAEEQLAEASNVKLIEWV